MRWRDHVQCGDTNPQVYDLEKQHKIKDRQARAAELCAGCLVIAQCAQDALEADDSCVVRGGMWIPDYATLIEYQRDEYRAKLASIAEVTA